MEKGKIIIEVAGQTYDLKLGFRAVQIAESELGKGVLEVYSSMIINRGKLTDLWVLIWACVNSQNSKMTYDKFLTELDDTELTFNEILELTTALIENSFPKGDKKKKGDSDQKN